jgi:hypothetical protein
MSTYDFSTQGGSSVGVSLPIGPAIYDSYRVDFAATENFETIALTKTVTPVDNNVVVSLTSNEVDTIKDAQFRLVATKNSVDNVLWVGGIDYIPARPSTATVTPPTIRRFVHTLAADPGRFGFDIPVTWSAPFPNSTYNVDAIVLDAIADTQQVQVAGWVENGDGTGGTISLNVIANPSDLAAGQHIEIWGYV